LGCDDFGESVGKEKQTKSYFRPYMHLILFPDRLTVDHHIFYMKEFWLQALQSISITLFLYLRKMLESQNVKVNSQQLWSKFKPWVTKISWNIIHMYFVDKSTNTNTMSFSKVYSLTFLLVRFSSIFLSWLWGNVGTVYVHVCGMVVLLNVSLPLFLYRKTCMQTLVVASWNLFLLIRPSR
jgi:hypothetical protein